MAILRLLLIVVTFTIATVSAHNITDILLKFPEYSQFNNYLTQTKLDDEINARGTVTVLVLNNTILSQFVMNQSLDVVKTALSIHILLDYFDGPKLLVIGGGSTITTTLYQTTGKAAGSTGFVNITDLAGKKVGFGSAATGSKLDALYERSVKQIPYNISVVEISSPIIAPGILNMPPPPPRVNFTSLLESAGCKTFARLISDTGVMRIYETAEARGLTVFAPTDAAFKAPGLPDFSKLTNTEFDSLLLYHAIPVYVPKVSLMAEKFPIRTLASNEISGFYLTVRTKGDSVTLSSGIDNSRVESMVLDSVPVSVFKIDHVLLPAGFFPQSPSPAVVPVPEASPPSPSSPSPPATPPSAHRPIASSPPASSPAPVATTSPNVSPPAPPVQPTSAPGSAPAPAEVPAADAGSSNSGGGCGGINFPVLFIALVVTGSFSGMISSIVG